MPSDLRAPSLRVIVLAAQRDGVTDPLAARFGVSHKCLVPINGRTLIERVVTTVGAHPRVASVAVSIDANGLDGVRAVLDAAGLPRATVAFVPAENNLADSVIAAARGHDGPLIVTTADNVLLSRRSIDAVAKAMEAHEAVIAMAPREAVLAAHPEGQRRFYRFVDGEYSNCNLYGLASSRAPAATEAFRGGGQFAKKVGRIITAFGLLNLILMRLRLLTLNGALRRISRRVGVVIAPVVLTDGSQAIDVDNDRTYRIAAQLLGDTALPALADTQPAFT